MSFLRASANFLFPPIMGYFSAKASREKFENQIYRSALVGSLVGFFVGFMTTVALVMAGLIGPFTLLNSLVGASLLTYGLPLFIGLPWLFSIIGRGLGFVHGIRHTLKKFNNSSYEKPNNIAVVACIFAGTGDAFVKEFYTRFHPSNTFTLHQTNFLRKMNEIGCLHRVRRNINFPLYFSANKYSAHLLSDLHRIGFIDNSQTGQSHLEFVFLGRPWIRLTINLMKRHGLLNLDNIELLYQHFHHDRNFDAILYSAISSNFTEAQKNFQTFLNRVKLPEQPIKLDKKKVLRYEPNPPVEKPPIVTEQKNIRAWPSVQSSPSESEYEQDLTDGFLSLKEAGILNDRNKALLVKDREDNYDPPSALRTAQALIKLHQANLLEKNSDFLKELDRSITVESFSYALIEFNNLSIPSEFRSLLDRKLIPFIVELHNADILAENRVSITENVKILNKLQIYELKRLSKALRRFAENLIKIDDRLRLLLIHQANSWRLLEIEKAFIQFQADGILPQHYDLIVNKLISDINSLQPLMDMLNELKQFGIDTEDHRVLVIHYLKNCCKDELYTRNPSFIKLLHEAGILEEYQQILGENTTDAQTLSEGILTLHKSKFLNEDLKNKKDNPYIKYLLKKPKEAKDRAEIIKILQGKPYLYKFLEQSAEVPAQPTCNYLQNLNRFGLLQSQKGEANAFYISSHPIGNFRRSPAVFGALNNLHKSGLLTEGNAQLHFDKLFTLETRGFHVASVINGLALPSSKCLNSENVELIYKNAQYINEVEEAFSFLAHNTWFLKGPSEENAKRTRAILENADRAHHIYDPEASKDQPSHWNEITTSNFVQQALRKPPMKKLPSTGKKMQALLADTQTPKDSKVNPSVLPYFGRGVLHPTADLNPSSIIKKSPKKTENTDELRVTRP